MLSEGSWQEFADAADERATNQRLARALFCSDLVTPHAGKISTGCSERY